MRYIDAFFVKIYPAIQNRDCIGVFNQSEEIHFSEREKYCSQNQRNTYQRNTPVARSLNLECFVPDREPWFMCSPRLLLAGAHCDCVLLIPPSIGILLAGAGAREVPRNRVPTHPPCPPLSLLSIQHQEPVV